MPAGWRLAWAKDLRISSVPILIAPQGHSAAHQISSGTILIAPQGHSAAQMPQPLQ